MFLTSECWVLTTGWVLASKRASGVCVRVEIEGELRERGEGERYRERESPAPLFIGSEAGYSKKKGSVNFRG